MFGLGVRIRGPFRTETLSIRSLSREPKVGLRRIPFKGSPYDYLGRFPAVPTRLSMRGARCVWANLLCCLGLLVHS